MHPACSISIYSSKYKHGFHGMRVCGNPGNTGLLLWMLTRTTNVRLIVPSERSLSCIWRTNYCAQLFQDITEPFLWQLMLICSLKILSRDELAAAESRIRAGEVSTGETDYRIVVIGHFVRFVDDNITNCDGLSVSSSCRSLQLEHENQNRNRWLPIC